MKLHDVLQLNLIPVSALISIVASWIGLACADVSRASDGRRHEVWIAAGASFMGFGIWSAHALGMLTLPGPTPITYSLPMVGISLAASIFASVAALHAVAYPSLTRGRFAAGVLLMAGDMVVMHYAGIAAMRLQAMPQYNPLLLALSLLLTVAFSALTIRIAAGQRGSRMRARISAAAVLGLGIAVVQSLSLLTSHFTVAPGPADGDWTIELSTLGAFGIAGIAALVLAGGLIATSIDRHLLRQEDRQAGMLTELQDGNALRAAIVDSSALAILTTDRNGIVQSFNRAAEEMLLYLASEVIGRMSLTEFHDPVEIEEQAIRLSVQLKYGIPADIEAIVTPSDEQKLDEQEWTYIRKDGARIPVRLAVSVLHGAHGEDIGFLVMAQDISAQRSAENAVRHLALHDPLTGLPNRALLEEQIVRSLALAGRHKLQVALAVIDLDRFQQINDSLGRETGDRILLTIARRLTETVRASDMVVRLGSDEFVILMPGIEHPRQSGEAMQRVLQALAEPVIVDADEHYVTPSIGISSFPGDGHDLNTLLRKADRAMYKAKSRGRNSIAVFSAEFEKEASSLLAMDTALRRALKRDEFFLVYQPIFSIATGRISSVEALIRWQQADGSVLAPAGFIPLAEETGLIAKIGEWVLRTACAQAGMFSRAAGRPLRIAVNVSPCQFREPALLSAVKDAMSSAGMAPGQLELEITEGVLLDDSDEAENTIERLREMGVQIAMDDFGTGYSSLGYLKRFPIDRLKIDRSFVTGMESTQNDLNLTAAVIKMGHSFDARVTAEGVETATQWQYLCEQGCDDAQGFYLAKPMRAERLVEFLLNQASEASGPRPLPAAISL